MRRQRQTHHPMATARSATSHATATRQRRRTPDPPPPRRQTKRHSATPPPSGSTTSPCSAPPMSARRTANLGDRHRPPAAPASVHERGQTPTVQPPSQSNTTRRGVHGQGQTPFMQRNRERAHAHPHVSAERRPRVRRPPPAVAPLPPAPPDSAPGATARRRQSAAHRPTALARTGSTLRQRERQRRLKITHRSRAHVRRGHALAPALTGSGHAPPQRSRSIRRHRAPPTRPQRLIQPPSTVSTCPVT